MKYYLLSILPFLACPMICLLGKRRIDAYLSIEYWIIIILFLIILLLMKRHVTIKYFAYASLFAFPFTFVASFFIVFSLMDTKFANFLLKDQFPIISNLYIFIPVTIFHICLSLSVSKFIKYFIKKRHIQRSGGDSMLKSSK